MQTCRLTSTDDLSAPALLAARAPRLDRALKKIARSGGGVALLDGSLIRTRRRTGTENRKNYSGKHKCHGLLVIALTDDKGRLAWVSAVRAPVEHGFAHLKNWRALGTVRTDPKWATALVRALLVLTNREVAR